MSVWKRMPELDPAIQKRIRLEWKVIRRVVMAAIADGCSYSLDYLCDDEELAVADSVKISELREAIHACDEERIYPSSKACSTCGFINQSLTLSDRSWVCPRCRVEHDRDFNAATNILMEGKRTVGTTGLAGGEKRQSSARKQFSVKPEAATSLRAKASRG